MWKNNVYRLSGWKAFRDKCLNFLISASSFPERQEQQRDDENLPPSCERDQEEVEETGENQGVSRVQQSSETKEIDNN